MKQPEPKILHTLRDDVRRGDFWRSVRREYTELREYMLDEQRRQRLMKMGAWRRWLITMFWLLKSMFFNLRPARRIILVTGILLSFFSHSFVFKGENFAVTNDFSGIGVLLILFVLALELKDKLVARKELEAGREIHKALMPERSPKIPGWSVWLFERPALDVGGDLVDFIRYHDQKCSVLLGDVSGKGLRAALLAAKLQSSLRALAPDVGSVDELARRMNKIFFRDTPPGVFASLVYCEIDLASGVIDVLNAGHLPPFIIRRGSVELLPKGDAALGLNDAIKFRSQRIMLEEGDMFLAFSDGLNEARNQSMEFFGDDRLVAILKANVSLTPQRLGETIVHSVDKFVGEAIPHDDLSIVILKRESAS